MPPFQFEERFPLQLMAELQTLLGLSIFVETGSGSGNTAGAAAAYFKEVHTIELHEPTFRQTRADLVQFPNVTCHFGESADVLMALRPQLVGKPVFFWLDAHYSGEGTACGPVECPVFSELAAIELCNSGQPLVVAIDDARLFLGVPPAPHKAADWPPLAALVDCHYLARCVGFHHLDTLFWTQNTAPVQAWLSNYVRSKRARILSEKSVQAVRTTD